MQIYSDCGDTVVILQEGKRYELFRIGVYFEVEKLSGFSPFVKSLQGKSLKQIVEIARLIGVKSKEMADDWIDGITDEVEEEAKEIFLSAYRHLRGD